MNADDSTSPEFWSSRYATGRTPWDLHGVPEALHAFLARSASQGCVLIPGCGSGYEVQAFVDAGYEVTALDFSPVAIERAQGVLGRLADRVRLSDFFTHNFAGERFDLIYERTFLCSLPPARWRDYAMRMSELLAVGGSLVGIFLYGHEPEPPPFPLGETDAADLLGGSFRLSYSEPFVSSLPVFRGLEERWQEWTRRD
jgi:SAM-dependent methyltransferase